jgi:hypothetical protein
MVEATLLSITLNSMLEPYQRLNGSRQGERTKVICLDNRIPKF